MDMNVIQNLQQEQRLILTTEMQISLKILQMPISDLQDCIDKELEENPVLEIDYETGNDEEQAAFQEATSSVLINDGDRLDYNKLIKQSEHDYFYEERYKDYERVDETNPLNYVSAKTSLKEYLMEQLVELKETKETIKLCEYIIESINDNGFVEEDISEIAEKNNTAQNIVKHALNVVHNLEPCGIGARDLKECLKIQLRKKDIRDNKIYKIIDNYMELIAENKYKELSRKIGVNIENVQMYADIIKSLEPKPSRGFYTGEETRFILPEAYIKKIGGDYYILMNDDMIPKLNINSFYREIIKNENNKETLNFIKDKINGALYFIKGIEQRKNTIYRVIEKIIEIQKDYFDKGEMYLKPMTIRDISIDLNLHESTISRAIKDKYICTPSGTLKIKNLFTGGITTTDNTEDISTNTIKRAIKRLINEEDKLNPISDQVISNILSKMNMSISRRTVAKYREELGIKPSSKRRIFS